MTISSFAQHIDSELTTIYDKNEIRVLFQILMEEYTNFSQMDILMKKNQELSKESEPLLLDAVKRLKIGEPVQHITGHCEFLGQDFYVDQNTLIPRPETEELVQLIKQRHTNEREKNLRILDIGTGSGCIAISLASHFRNAKVFAWDISPDALSIAKKNAMKQNVNVNFAIVDILKESDSDIVFDIIISNPPYITEVEKLEMHRTVTEFEPHSALFVPDNDSLLFYKAISRFASNHLSKDGSLYFEINRSKGKEISKLLTELKFHNVTIDKDISENYRFAYATH